MGALLVASFAVIAQQIPERKLLKRTTWLETSVLFAFSIVVGLVPVAFPVPTTEDTDPFPLAMMAILSLGCTILYILITWFLINSYAADRFSLKEIFVLDVLLTAGAGAILCLAGLLAHLSGVSYAGLYDFAGLIFGLYILYISMITVRKVASITAREAVVVVLAPVFIILALWICLLAGAFGAAGFSGSS